MTLSSDPAAPAEVGSRFLPPDLVRIHSERKGLCGVNFDPRKCQILDAIPALHVQERKPLRGGIYNAGDALELLIPNLKWADSQGFTNQL